MRGPAEKHPTASTDKVLVDNFFFKWGGEMEKWRCVGREGQAGGGKGGSYHRACVC